MAVILSQHTRLKNIPQAYIEAVIAKPAYTAPDRKDPSLGQRSPGTSAAGSG
jgi:hypothetical protein